jgi:ribosomal protein L7/L12
MHGGTRDVKHPMLSGLPRPVLQVILVVLEKVFALLRKKAVYPFPYNESTHTISLPAQIERELRGLISTGNKAEAMKRVISLTGAGLRVSKDYVDQLAKRH